MRSRQQGIALITILMLVALATIIAATIAKRQSYTNDSTAYMMRQSQSLYYAKSAEAFFSELLVQDAESDSKADYLHETWAKPMPAFPIDGGYVSGQLIDESGKFNLNALLKDDGTPNEESRQFFEGLLKRVGLPAEVSQAVIDWQDPDDLTIGAMGAESNYYSGMPNGYLVANAPFQSAEELKQVRGFEGLNFDLIAPYVTAAPNNLSKININTASALVLASLDEKLDINTIDQVLKQKSANMEYFSNVDELWQLEPFTQVDPQKRPIAIQVFDVNSNFFKAQIEVVLSERKRQFSSYLWRKDQHVSIFSRSLAPF